MSCICISPNTLHSLKVTSQYHRTNRIDTGATMAEAIAPKRAAKRTTTTDNDKVYSPERLAHVVAAARTRALEVGKPDLAACVVDSHVTSLNDERLTLLLEAILMQTATPPQIREFQEHVRVAKRHLVS